MKILVLLLILLIITGVFSSVLPNRKDQPNPVQLMEKLRYQIKAKEEELERAEQVNKNFERMIQLVNIMGQVDSFLTDRTKAVIRKLAILVDDENESNRSDE